MNQQQAIDKQQEAWQLATSLHSEQTYGGQQEGERIAYINHIGSVVFEVMNAFRHENGFNEELGILCATLHDTLEDTETTFENLEQLFGPEVAEGVLALTKNEALETKEEQMLDSLNRIKTQPKEIWAVKMADRICNLYAPPFYWTDKKKMKYIQEAQLIHDHLKDGSHYLSKRLSDKIERYKQYLS